MQVTDARREYHHHQLRLGLQEDLQAYNGRGAPYSLSGSVAGTLVSSALYNQLGSMKEVNLGNGLRTLFNYHGIDAVDDADPENYWGRLYRIKTLPQAGGTALQHQKYWWDDNGNLVSRKDEVASETERFSYDNLDRLVGVSGPYTESFTYDVLGNIKTKNGAGYTYSNLQPHAVRSVGSYNQDYDANGNMTARANATGTQTLTWSVENLLSQVDGTGGRLLRHRDLRV